MCDKTTVQYILVVKNEVKSWNLEVNGWTCLKSNWIQYHGQKKKQIKSCVSLHCSSSKCSGINTYSEDIAKNIEVSHDFCGKGQVAIEKLAGYKWYDQEMRMRSSMHGDQQGSLSKSWAITLFTISLPQHHNICTSGDKTTYII